MVKRDFNKKGFEFNYAWFFAIIVGAIIIFLAIYGVGKIGETGERISSSEAAQHLGIVFDPLETGVASGKKSYAEFSSEIRIKNKCYDSNTFGWQEFSISEKERNKWTLEGIPFKSQNKYIFSQDIIEGDRFEFFSKPFEFPFKISDVIFMTSDKYCFISPPSEIREEIEGLEFENIQVSFSSGNCTPGSTKVCFGMTCDIGVYDLCSSYDCYSYDYGYVEQGSEKSYYVGSLMYGAIFSSPKMYECNVNRLLLRLKQVSYLYADQATFLVRVGCGDNMKNNLLSLASKIPISDTSQLIQLKSLTDNLENQNDATVDCELW